MKIVIVEDEMRIKEGLSNLIKKLYPDCEVAAMADNGKEGLECIRRIKPDLVFTDIRMPVMNGLEAAAAIRAGAKADAKTIPIIAMSANAFAEDMEKSRRAGMNRHVAKPVEPERLFGVLSEIFSD